MSDKILDKKTLPVNHERSRGSSIRIVRNGKDPHILVPHSLLYDSKLSPSCRWLIMWFMTNPEDFEISISDLVKEFGPDTDREEALAVIKEAVSSGHLRRNENDQ